MRGFYSRVKFRPIIFIIVVLKTVLIKCRDLQFFYNCMKCSQVVAFQNLVEI